MSIRFTGDKTAARRITNLPTAHNAFTICGFAKLLVAGTAREATILYTQNASSSSAQTASLATGAGTSLRAGDNYGGTFSSGVATVTAGGASGANWFFFAMVGLGSGANGMRVYHGAVSGTPTYVAHTNTGGTEGFEAIQLGDLPYGTDGWFDGLIAHLKVYDRVLSDADLLAEAGRGDPASSTNLISYHSFSNATLATALLPDTGSGAFYAFTSNPTTSTDMPVFSTTGPTLTGDDTLPQLSGVAPTIITTSLPDGLVDIAYSASIAASGDAPITWSVTTGSLPSGLSLGSSTGTIAGSPTAAGSSSFTITATNSIGSDPQALTIDVTQPGTAPDIVTSTLTTGTVGVAYSRSLVATGTAPISWSVTAGALPTGLSLSSSTGTISGTPTVPGTYSFTATATNDDGDDSVTFSLQVFAAVPIPDDDGDGWIRLPRDAEIWVRIPRSDRSDPVAPTPDPDPPPPDPETPADRMTLLEEEWTTKYEADYEVLFVANQGTVVYIDLSLGSGGAGTFGNPYGSLPTFTTGNTYLFKQGTTYTGQLNVSVTNVVLGTYATADGARVFDKSLLFTVDMNGGRFGVNVSQDDVTLSGIRVTNLSAPYVGASTLAIYCSKSGGANDCVIEHCWIDGVSPGVGMFAVSGGIYVRGSGALVRNNKVTTSPLDAIYIGYNGAADGPDGALVYGNYIHHNDSVPADGPDCVQIASNGTQFGDVRVYDNWLLHESNTKQCIVITGTSADTDYCLVKQNYCFGPDIRNTALGVAGKSILVDVKNARIEGNYVEAADWGIGTGGNDTEILGNTIIFDTNTAHSVGIIAQANDTNIRFNTIVLASGTCINAIEQTSASHSGIVIADNIISGAFNWGIRYRATAASETRNIIYNSVVPVVNQGGTAVSINAQSSTADPLLSSLWQPLVTSPAIETGGAVTPTFVDIYGNEADLTTPNKGAMQVTGA